VTCLWNPLRPVNRLPPEILALCAAFVPRTDPKPIVSLAHVCRYWREAITSNPGSWTLIGNKWERLVPLCLERAGVAPLTVDLWIGGLKRKFVHALLPHVTRISSLSLTACTSLKDMEDFLSSPMLNPTSLKFKSPYWPEIHLYPILSNIKSVVELNLTSYKIPFKELIRFLESNPCIERLELFIMFTNAPALTTLERAVSIPRLRHLALTCYSNHATDARALLSSLSLPRGINIEIHEAEHESRGDLASFLPSPPTFIQDILAPIITVKDLCFEGRLHLSGNDGSFSFHSPKVSKNHYEYFDMFATGAVREFHLHLGWRDPPPLLLEQLPALEALLINQTRPRRGLLSVLAEDPVLCPSLKTIVLFNCLETDAEIKQLEEISEKREHSIAARLHRIVIVNHTQDFPKLDSVSRLRMLVPRVDFVVGNELPDLL